MNKTWQMITTQSIAISQMTTVKAGNKTINKIVSGGNDVSAEGLFISNLILNVILNNVLCTFGMIGNIFNVIVLSRPKFKDTTSFLLLSVSVVDFFVSAIQCLFRLPNIIWYVNPRLSDIVFCFYMTYFHNWGVIFLDTSVFYVALVAVERMIAVCFPFRVAVLVTKFRVRLLTVSGFIFYVSLSGPYLNMLYTWTYYDGNNVAYARIAYSKLFVDNWELLLYYRFITTMLFVYFLPITLITFSTLLITHSMALNWKNLKKLSTTNSAKRLKEMKSTKTALYVCLTMMVFILIPSFIFDMLSWFREDLFPVNKNRSTIVYYVMTLLGQMNSFFNFIIYVATSPKFAHEFKDIIFCSHKKLRKKYK